MIHDDLTPRQIVAYLDKYIIGQEKAKKSVAIALRNRWRRQQLESSIRKEIMPNNIILIGPTGVGKTEIARRLANLTHSPFIKVEASRFTEVGYMGRDVESLIRDLIDVAYNAVKLKYIELNRITARRQSLQRVSEILTQNNALLDEKTLEQDIESGRYDEVMIESEVSSNESPILAIDMTNPSRLSDDLNRNVQDIMETMMHQQKKLKKMTVPEAEDIFFNEFLDDLIDQDTMIRECIEEVEENGIVFLDEIDKVAGETSGNGPDVSREGVQRDLLPIIEGTSVFTKYGLVKTDHILFIAAGAFHVSSPSDLIPELQGRFPIRVEMDDLSADDFEKILTLPENALIKQYQALFKAEGISLCFRPASIRKIAEMADKANECGENIGARRLHTVLSIILEEYLYDAPEIKKKRILITEKEIIRKLDPILQDEDLSRYIL